MPRRHNDMVVVKGVDVDDDGFSYSRAPDQQRQTRFKDRSRLRTVTLVEPQYGRNKGHHKTEKGDPASQNLLDLYETRQAHGYLAIFFSVAQTGIMVAMMMECGVAPLQINPMIGPYPDALSYWGAKNSAKILEDGENWRLLSPMLLHAGVLHLVGNVGAQLDAGMFWECEWGSLNWLIIYVFSALGSSILSMIVLPQNLSVGSSGSILGLFGAKLVELLIRIWEPKVTVQQRVAHEVRRHQLYLVVGGIVIVAAMSFIPYVDWAAHLGGLIAGICVGMAIFSAEYMEYFICKLLWAIMGVALTATGFMLSLQYMYQNVQPQEELRDVCSYYQQFFDDYECSCTLDDYRQDGGDSNDAGGAE